MIMPAQDTRNNYRVLRALEAFMLYCRKNSLLNACIRRPLQVFWCGGWSLYFRIRNLCLGPICELNVNTCRLLVDLRDTAIARRLYQFKVYEHNETTLIRSLVSGGDTVLDIGANIGYHTLLFSTLVGKTGHVFAFEPSPWNFDLLTRNLELNGTSNVTAFECAVTDQPGEVSLMLARDNFGGHSLGELADRASVDGTNEVRVTCRTVDEMVARQGIRPDFIKMDIEGAEVMALRGMQETLESNSDILMLCEINSMALASCGTDAKEFVETLNEMAFRFFEILDNGWLREVSVSSILCKALLRKNFNILVSRNDARSLLAAE